MTMQDTRTDTSISAESQNHRTAWELISPSESGSDHSYVPTQRRGAISGVQSSDAETFIPADPVPGIELWLTGNSTSSVTTTSETQTRNPLSTNAWLSPETIAEAKNRFKDEIEDAEEDEIPVPSDLVLSNALRAVQMIEDHCPQGLSSVAVLEVGMEATARGGTNHNYVSVECQPNGEVLVMFNVRSYADYKDMDEAEREGFLKALLETLRY